MRRHQPEPAQVSENRGHARRLRLYSGARVGGEDGPILKRLWEFGEETLARLAEEALSSRQVAALLSAAITRAFATKACVDRSLQTLLALLNMPSRGDVTRLLTKLEAIQGSLVNLNLKVDRLLAERPPRRAGRRRPARPPEEE